MENQTDVNVEAAKNKKLAAIGKEFIRQFNLMERDACIKVREGCAND